MPASPWPSSSSSAGDACAPNFTMSSTKIFPSAKSNNMSTITVHGKADTAGIIDRMPGILMTGDIWHGTAKQERKQRIHASTLMRGVVKRPLCLLGIAWLPHTRVLCQVLNELVHSFLPTTQAVPEQSCCCSHLLWRHLAVIVPAGTKTARSRGRHPLQEGRKRGGTTRWEVPTGKEPAQELYWSPQTIQEAGDHDTGLSGTMPTRHMRAQVHVCLREYTCAKVRGCVRCKQ